MTEYSLDQLDQGGNFDALVIDHFRGTEFEILFNQLRSELMVLNLSPEQAEAEFRDSLPKLERDHIDQQLNELQAKAKIGTFSRADADRMEPSHETQGRAGSAPGRKSSRGIIRGFFSNTSLT